MMNGLLREHLVVLTVVVLCFTILSISHAKGFSISHPRISSSNNSGEGGDYDARPISEVLDIAGSSKSVIKGNSENIQGLSSSYTLEKSSVNKLIPSINAKTNDSQKEGAFESGTKVSNDMLSESNDKSEISSNTPTTYKPARPSVLPNNITQVRELKLMNVLAARRNALHNGRFRARIGTTSRTTLVEATNTTSKTPTDSRSVCLMNCTKNFTRRTTASCMRQCSRFSGAYFDTLNATTPNNSIVIVRLSSRIGSKTPISDGNHNEILFTDESSHGLFVVAKDQNDTFNHIPDIKKPQKLRSRNKLLSTVSIPSSSVEEDDIQPYLYFGQKLPPFKPGTLKITSVSEEHPKLLEVFALHVSSTTPNSMSTLSEVERSRSRYKYRDRGYISVRRSPIRTSSLSSTNSTEMRNGFLINRNNTSIITNLTVVQENTGGGNAFRKTVTQPNRIGSTKLPILHSTTPLIIKVFGEEDESSQPYNPLDTTTVQDLSYRRTLQAGSNINSKKNFNNFLVQNTTSPTSNLFETTSEATPVNTISLRPIIATTIPAVSKTSNTKTSSIINITTSIPISVPITTQAPKSIIREGIHSSFAPKVTPIVQKNENLIFLNITTPLNTNTTNVTDIPTSIFSTTLPSYIDSTVNPNNENKFLKVESSSNLLNKNDELFYVDIIETTPKEKLIRHKSPSTTAEDIQSTHVADESNVSQEMRRVNIATMVLGGIGIIPLCALGLYLVRSYFLRKSCKNEEDFDVCITDQQPISPVRKLDSKYRNKGDEEEGDTNRHTAYISNQHSTHDKITSRNTNYNNHYDERCSVISDQEFDRGNIRLKSLLGEGNFGQVWKAEADDLSGHFGATRIVAVKTIRKCSTQSSLKEEADIMRKLGSHQNVVTLLGACVESEPHMLIMEYAMRGRLLSLLRAARSATNILPASVPGGRSLTPLSPRTLGGFALDIACGMEYIAEKRIVHRDLAARNILLDHNGICKICDFGMSIDLDAERKRKEADNYNKNDIMHHNTKKNKFDFGSRFIINHWNTNFNGSNCSPTLEKEGSEKKPVAYGHGHDTISRRPALPIRWMAPEALQYHIFTRETDIWAFGIVLWEISTLGSTPYANLTGREVIRRVPNGVRPDPPKEGRHEFYSLMRRCWNKDPHLRPSFTYSRQEISRSMHKWADDDSATSDYMDVSGFSEDLEHGIVYFNHRISELECEI